MFGRTFSKFIATIKTWFFLRQMKVGGWVYEALSDRQIQKKLFNLKLIDFWLNQGSRIQTVLFLNFARLWKLTATSYFHLIASILNWSDNITQKA